MSHHFSFQSQWTCPSPFSQPTRGSLQAGTQQGVLDVCFISSQGKAGLSVSCITRCCAHSRETGAYMTNDPRCLWFCWRSTVRGNNYRASFCHSVIGHIDFILMTEGFEMTLFWTHTQRWAEKLGIRVVLTTLWMLVWDHPPPYSLQKGPWKSHIPDFTHTSVC